MRPLASRFDPNLVIHGDSKLLLAAEVMQMCCGRLHYLQADLATKEKALEKLHPLGTGPERFRPKDDLLAFLSSL